MVEWLLANSLATGWSFTAYTTQFTGMVNDLLENRLAMWVIVVVLIILLPKLTKPRTF
ncbi:MAG: hypothetical protein AB7G75_24315 [Candidatus Binatia bacterium]